MNPIYEKLVKCADAVKSKIKFQPQVALILGSGLGDYAETMQVEETMEYTEIEGFPVSTVAGHKGRFLFGYVEGVRLWQCREECISMRDTRCRMWCFRYV